MSLLLNMLSGLVITFLQRSKRLLISWLLSPSAVILEPKIIKSVTVSIVSPSICHEVMGPDAMILVFWILSFKPTFSLSSFNKGPSSQGYGFSSSHVWMWELDYKESWAQKSWCFWTVGLEKTLESPLESKEIQPVNPKGNQSWIFIGRIDTESETPDFGLLVWRTDSFEKTLILGTIEGRRRRGRQRMRWLDGITDLVDMSLSELGVGDGQGGLACCGSWGHKESDMTELNWTELNKNKNTKVKKKKKGAVVVAAELQWLQFFVLLGAYTCQLILSLKDLMVEQNICRKNKTEHSPWLQKAGIYEGDCANWEPKWIRMQTLTN